MYDWAKLFLAWREPAKEAPVARWAAPLSARPRLRIPARAIECLTGWLASLKLQAASRRSLARPESSPGRQARGAPLRRACTYQRLAWRGRARAFDANSLLLEIHNKTCCARPPDSPWQVLFACQLNQPGRFSLLGLRARAKDQPERARDSRSAGWLARVRPPRRCDASGATAPAAARIGLRRRGRARRKPLGGASRGRSSASAQELCARAGRASKKSQ